MFMVGILLQTDYSRREKAENKAGTKGLSIGFVIHLIFWRLPIQHQPNLFKGQSRSQVLICVFVYRRQVHVQSNNESKLQLVNFASVLQKMFLLTLLWLLFRILLWAAWFLFDFPNVGCDPYFYFLHPVVAWKENVLEPASKFSFL